MLTILAAVLVTALAVVDDVDDRVHFVESLHESGLHELVVDEARGFLADHADHAAAPRVRYRLADALFELGRGDDAAEHDRRLVELRDFPWRAEAALRLGQCELAGGRLQPAREALTLARNAGAEYLQAPAAFLLGELAFREERFDAAAQHYADVLRLRPDAETARDARAAAAWCALRLGQHGTAATRVQEVLAAQPTPELAREMRFVRAEARLEAGQPGRALEDYAAIDSGPFADAALRGAGFAHVARGDAAAAVRSFESLLARFANSPHRAEVALQLGVQQLLLGDARAADATLSGAHVADDAASRYWRARTRAALDDPETALLLLERAEQAGPDESLRGHIATLRGDLLAASGRTAEAAEAYARGGSSAALSASAVARLNAGDFAGALQQVEPLLAAAPRDGTLLLARAESLFGLQRWGDAATAFEQAAPHVEPELRARVASRRAWSHYLSGDAAGAASLFGRLVRDHADAPEAVEGLAMQGRACDESGDTRGAVKAWKAYVQRHPEGERHAEGLLALGRLQTGAASLSALQRLADEHADDPAVPAALLAVGDGYAAAGDPSTAAQTYARLVETQPLAPEVPAARAGLAWALVDLGALEQAADVLDDLVAPPRRPARRQQASPAVPEPALVRDGLELLVWCRHELGDPAAAERAFQRFAAQDVEPARILEAARSVVTAWTTAGRPERALALLDELGRQPGLGQAAHREAAWVALDAGQFDSAAAHAQAALDAETSDAGTPDAETLELAFFVAEALADHEPSAVSLGLYTAAAQPGAPRRAEALYKLGYLQLQAGALDDADAALTLLADEHADSPLHGEALFLLGETRYRAGRLEPALQPLRRVLDEHAGHQVVPKARFRLGLALAQLGRWRDAEPVLTRLAQGHADFPNLLEAELWRGRCLAALGRDRQARAALARVVAEDSGVLAARARLTVGRLDMDAGSTNEALSEFLKVAFLYGHDEEVAEALLLAGRCLETLGDAARAADRYREVLDEHPQAAAAREARARLDDLSPQLGVR